MSDNNNASADPSGEFEKQRARLAELEAELARDRPGVSGLFDGILLPAIERAPIGFVILDPDLRLIVCNQRFRDIYRPVGGTWTTGTSFAQIARDIARRHGGDLTLEHTETPGARFVMRLPLA